MDLVRSDIVTNDGFRQDGRKRDELRAVNYTLSTNASFVGSCIVEHGRTKVACNVVGPCEPKENVKGQEGCIITVSIEICSFSGTDRRKRSKYDGKILDMQELIKDALSAVIITSTYPRSEIRIYLNVLQVDGGILTACVNAATLGLVDAGIAMTDYICGCTVGLHKGSGILDLNYLEECDIPYINAASVGSTTKIALLLMESSIHATMIVPLLEKCLEACHEIRKVMEDAAREAGKEFLDKILHAS